MLNLFLHMLADQMISNTPTNCNYLVIQSDFAGEFQSERKYLTCKIFSMRDCWKIGKVNQNWLSTYSPDPEFIRAFKSTLLFSNHPHHHKGKAKWLQKYPFNLQSISQTLKWLFFLNKIGFTFSLFPNYTNQNFQTCQM